MSSVKSCGSKLAIVVAALLGATEPSLAQDAGAPPPTDTSQPSPSASAASTPPAPVASAVTPLAAPAAPSAEKPPVAQSAVTKPPVQMPEVVVQSRAEDLLGVANSASQGNIGAPDLENLPVLRRGELFESVPGMIVTQHSGDGKANQYFLRGFNLDHGTDFAFSVDSVPVNLPSHAHGQGYSDLNFLIPELIDHIDYRKGPFFPEVGDFSGAGAANIHLVNSLPEGIANVQVGQFNYARALIAASPQLGPGTLLYAFEYNHYDGPWDLPENSNRYNGLLRYRWGRGTDEFNVTASAYWAPSWHSTDQVPQRAINEGIIDRFGNIDPTDGGRTGRDALSFDWTHHGEDTTTKLLVYGFYYQLNLWSDFDYALTDPVNLDQFEQVDRRYVTGAQFRQTWDSVWFGKKVENTLGVQVQNDAIPDSGLNNTADRTVLDVEVYDHIEEINAGVYGENQIRWTSWLRSAVGLRGDVFDVHVDSTTNAANSGNAAAALVSPKASLVFGPWEKTEFYVDAGTGFHSNDARGVTISVDAAGQPQGRVPLLVRTKGAEVGTRTSIIPGLVSTVSLWFLQSNSELTFDGDSGDTEANGASRRYGIEWANFYKPIRWLTLSADFSLTHARYLTPQKAADGASGEYIANSIPMVVSGTAVVETPSGFFGGARVRYFSSQPVIEDDTERQPASTIVNLLAGYRFGQCEISGELLNAFNAKADDIAYYYPSRLPTALLAAHRLPAQPAAGVNDFVIHPAEPLEARASLTARF